MRFALGPLVAVVLLAAAPSASSLTLSGHASSYGSDPVAGIYDHEDNGIPALAGYTNASPGIAVMRWDTLGQWWRVCNPWRVCRWVRQTDVGPASFTGRVLDVNAVAARVDFHLRGGYSFPTDLGRWTLALVGRHLSRSQRRSYYSDLCVTPRCKRHWAPRRPTRKAS